MTPRRVVVLGGTGGVGRQVGTAFAALGDEVTVVARRSRPSLAATAFHRLDIGADPGLTGILEGADIVVNATGSWARTDEELHYAHVVAVSRLTKALAALGGGPRLVHIGSIHEYGPVPEGTAIDESLRPDPRTPYARTKLEGSRLALEAGAVVLRVVNVFGPDTSPASFLGALAARLRDTLPGDRLDLAIIDARRDFVDVRDVAGAVTLAAAGPAAQVVNIGRGAALSLRDLVHGLVAAAGLPPETIRERGAARNQGGGDWTLADITRARRTLGWAPRRTVTDSLTAMAATIPSTTGS